MCTGWGEPCGLRGSFARKSFLTRRYVISWLWVKNSFPDPYHRQFAGRDTGKPTFCQINYTLSTLTHTLSTETPGSRVEGVFRHALPGPRGNWDAGLSISSNVRNTGTSATDPGGSSGDGLTHSQGYRSIGILAWMQR